MASWPRLLGAIAALLFAGGQALAGIEQCLQATTSRAALTRPMVPEEGLEPPTFGLQNRCTTAVLIRPAAHVGQSTPNVQPSLRAISGVRPSGAKAPGSVVASALMPAAVTSASVW